MIRWIGPLLLMMGFFNFSYAEVNQESQERENYTQAFWEVYTGALRGDKVAQFKVGVMYERGLGTDINETQASTWYEKSARQGYVDAQFNIGIMYASGRGVKQNDGVAMMWLALAAQQGDKEARHVLLTLIDQKAVPAKGESAHLQTVRSAQQNTERHAIPPVTLLCKEKSVVCSKYAGEGECTPYKTKTILTSKEKQGNFYKISGIGTADGWKEFRNEGWIEENSVEIRR